MQPILSALVAQSQSFPTVVNAKAPPHLNPKKLLLSKWTAAAPQNKEKHFLVVTLVMPDAVEAPIEHVELEAVHSRRRCVLPWRDLTDVSQCSQGWK